MVDFETIFRTLTGHPPFPWQAALFEEFLNHKPPKRCSLPTGLGKTSVMAIWLIALAYQQSKRVPRRLVYVVNRRTVVDQATAEAERLSEALMSPELAEFTNRLRILAGSSNSTEIPLAISTLRGQLADNGQWCVNPARPAIVIGTVDMIGSRLLFSGYGLGFRRKPLHAGFLGQDSLLVHDEAHLEPAFQGLLERIELEQCENERMTELPWPKLQIMAMTATSRNGNGQGGIPKDCPFELTQEERNPPAVIPDPPLKPVHHVWRRLNARKTVRLHENSDPKKLANIISELALRHKDDGVAVLVFVRKLDDVEKIRTLLTSPRSGVSLDRVEQLTGTMRGLERDQLVTTTVFRRFLPPGNGTNDKQLADKTVYLICTSAGEVGVDMSADHLVCDLSTFESMAQRFGRVNRYGNGRALIDVVFPSDFEAKDSLSPAFQNTLALLRKLPASSTESLSGEAFNACPRALGELATRDDLPCGIKEAFSPEPPQLPVTDILFDAWALTSIRGTMPGRPEVEPFLHGIEDWQPPETHVAWREEVKVFTDELLAQYSLAALTQLLDDYPLKPHELLRDQNARVFNQIKILAQQNPDGRVWILDERSEVEATPTLGQLANGQPDAIANKTILLPPGAGLSSQGTLDGRSDRGDDVADAMQDKEGRLLRKRLWDQESDQQYLRLVRIIDIRPDDENEQSGSDSAGQRYWYWYELPMEGRRTAKRPVLLKIHTADVQYWMEKITEQMALDAQLKEALVLAAKWHDAGKQDPRFQTTLGNHRSSDEPWAKSGNSGARLGEPFRHELASAILIQADPQFTVKSKETQELIRHLIVAHHGRARPHFALDEVLAGVSGLPQVDLDTWASEVPRCFARLQRKYGRWGLAYLESLLRAADWAASANPSSYVDDSEAKP